MRDGVGQNRLRHGRSPAKAGVQARRDAKIATRPRGDGERTVPRRTPGNNARYCASHVVTAGRNWSAVPLRTAMKASVRRMPPCAATGRFFSPQARILPGIAGSFEAPPSPTI